MPIRWLEYRPPRIAFALAVSAAAVDWLAGSARVVPATPAAWLPAVALGAGGFATMMAAWWQFRVANVAICPTARTARLLTDGIYRLTRNPMYLGMVMMLFSAALALGTPSFFLAAIAYFAVLNGVFCPYEEQKLSATFGETYDRYRESVRRWL